ncbi:ParA family protein [Streptomyces neyagawaensis]|uniref:ParA family protein n=1 Tax=Streptomyces neyagawaensis TaxID=42238 RepID=UPI000A5A76A6|nr:AAA family ATPase [Streptomyces neyagawaensis]MCL6736083.1 AAA family ATPase [Streptomyces neyagawaensis]MDE1684095.1 AAA family ATPase [Streptomyces neyagawaensis]
MAGVLPRLERQGAKSKPEVAPEEVLYTDTDRSGDTLDLDLSSLWWYGTDSDFRPKGRNWPLIWAYIIEGGGSTKTTSVTSMAVIAALDGFPGVVFDLDSNMSSTTVLGYDETALKGKKTAIDLLYGRATLDEVALPARYRVGDGDDPEEDFEPIENLRVVPGSPAMADADRAIAEDADRNDWFAEILRSYEGIDSVFYVDFPASYGKMPYSVLRMLDEEDSVIPSIKADPKAVKLVKRLTDELERVRDKNRGCRSVPGRPTLKHLILSGTQPLTWPEQVAARRATAAAEAMYSSVLLPYIRYSADAEKIYEDAVPLPILLPDSVASVDYREVMRRMWMFPYLDECGCDYCPGALE